MPGLPTLLRKAIGDAGFDLMLGPDAEWERIGISGFALNAWVTPTKAGALVALAERVILREFDTVTWTDVPLPGGAAGAVRCRSAAELYDTLRRVRVLVGQLPPVPEQRLARQLAAIGSTETDALVRQRVGQSLFREMLLEYWDGRCAVTGLASPELLRASHAKPWRDSTDAERLDVYNGFLLAVHLDALFDQGFMTFTAVGEAVFSNVIAMDELDVLVPVREGLRLRRLADAHGPYLEYHRRHVFRRRDTMSGEEPLRAI